MKRGVILAGMVVALIALCACMGKKPVQAETVKAAEAPKPTSQPVRDPYLKKDITELRNTLKIVGEFEPSFTEPEEEPEEGPEWVYYGECRITHYCPCSECCGEWATGCTASEVLATANHTVASGEDLPFGTEVLIGDQVYTVEDRGVGPYEIDIFVDDHQTALEMGMYYTDVYIRTRR